VKKSGRVFAISPSFVRATRQEKKRLCKNATMSEGSGGDLDYAVEWGGFRGTKGAKRKRANLRGTEKNICLTIGRKRMSEGKRNKFKRQIQLGIYWQIGSLVGGEFLPGKEAGGNRGEEGADLCWPRQHRQTGSGRQ